MVGSVPRNPASDRKGAVPDGYRFAREAGQAIVGVDRGTQNHTQRPSINNSTVKTEARTNEGHGESADGGPPRSNRFNYRQRYGSTN